MNKPLVAGVAALAIVLSLGLAACGSSDDSGDTATSEETLTKSELITEADALCAEFDGEVAIKINELFGNQQPNKQQIESFASDEVVPLYRDQVEQLRELQPEEADAEQWNDLLDTLESELDDLEADPASLASGEGAFVEATAKANEFGLETCGA